MTTFAFPGPTPTSQVLRFVSNTRTFTSPFTRSVQTISRGGESWAMRLSMQNLDGADRQSFMAFLVGQNGQEHRFTCGDHTYTRRGFGTGTPLVQGAGQTGYTLVTDGWTASITNAVRAGDQIQVGNELKMVMTDANSSAGGVVTLTIKPALRVSPADNAAIVITNPQGLWMLASPSSEWTTDPGVIFSDFVIEAIEDVLG